jgi:hypothetical protein
MLRNELEKRLRNMKWNPNTTMWDFYEQIWRPFGELLTDMEVGLSYCCEFPSPSPPVLSHS